jgi:hypothetical protein
MELLKQKLKTKKYQYLYLQQKLETRIEHQNYFCEMYDDWDNYPENNDRILFYSKWLGRINKKYNYV